ncbi:MAG: GDP-mannose 4,6-dehydratase [Candidatus Omnitrophica bacterium]|nr:GDP-mannose 4,6-dehydratase [Candidatus Omnitrophota bacterium]
MRPKRVLITGGAGFVGSHLAQALLEKENKVVIIDNLSTGSMDNIKQLKNNKRFLYHIDTIMNKRLMKRLIENSDIIYHLAAAVGVKFVIDNPLESIQINVRGTEILLELANDVGKKKVILASTSEIYGKNMDGKTSFKEEDDRVLGSTSISRWSYSCTKALDEFLALAYFREKKLPVVIVRLFNTCGPRQTGEYGMVIPRFIKQALLGQPITVYGDGTQTRSFTYVGDVVKAVIALAEHPKSVGEIFNVGNSRSISINELAQRIKKMTESSSKIVYVPYEKAYEKGFEDMKYRQPNTSKIREFINFKPTVDIDEMLESIIKDFER